MTGWTWLSGSSLSWLLVICMSAACHFPPKLLAFNCSPSHRVNSLWAHFLPFVFLPFKNSLTLCLKALFPDELVENYYYKTVFIFGQFTCALLKHLSLSAFDLVEFCAIYIYLLSVISAGDCFLTKWQFYKNRENKLLVKCVNVCWIFHRLRKAL